MNTQRIRQLRYLLEHPLLIKKKENLLYLTGRSFLNGYLLIFPGAKPVFFSDGLEKAEGMKVDILRNIGRYLKPEQTLEVFGEFTYAEGKYIKSKLNGTRLKVTVGPGPADFLRVLKEPGEIGKIRKSMEITGQVYKRIKQQLKRKPWTEIALAKFIVSEGHRLGADEISFPPIVASGANAATPHHQNGNKRLKAGESVILDFGFKYQGYCSDFTRTIFLKKVPEKLEAAYLQVEKAYKQSMLEARAGARAEHVYNTAVKVLKSKRLEKYFIHSLGHGTGLEIHELPNLSPYSKDILRPGMVFSIEPGVYLPKLGGVRLEDLVYLNSGGAKKFIDVPTSLGSNIIR